MPRDCFINAQWLWQSYRMSVVGIVEGLCCTVVQLVCVYVHKILSMVKRQWSRDRKPMTGQHHEQLHWLHVMVVAADDASCSRIFLQRTLNKIQPCPILMYVMT